MKLATLVDEVDEALLVEHFGLAIVLFFVNYYPVELDCRNGRLRLARCQFVEKLGGVLGLVTHLTHLFWLDELHLV